MFYPAVEVRHRLYTCVCACVLLHNKWISLNSLQARPYIVEVGGGVAERESVSNCYIEAVDTGLRHLQYVLCESVKKLTKLIFDIIYVFTHVSVYLHLTRLCVYMIMHINIFHTCNVALARGRVSTRDLSRLFKSIQRLYNARVRRVKQCSGPLRPPGRLPCLFLLFSLKTALRTPGKLFFFFR